MDLPFSEHSLADSGLPLPTGFLHGHLSSPLDSRASLQGLIIRQPGACRSTAFQQTAASPSCSKSFSGGLEEGGRAG